MKKYKYIHITQRLVDGKIEMFNGHPVYGIFNNRNKGQIGVLSFYKPWKEYVFHSKDFCVFNNTCLRDVIDFMENQIKK